MATVTERPYTPDDLMKITDRPTPELIGGELVEREPMGQEADAVATNLIYHLGGYARHTLPAIVNGAEGGYRIFPDEPNRVRFPDVSFTRKDRLPGGKPTPGYSTIPPDLAVEVVSPNNLSSDIYVKVYEYLHAGVPLVWVIDVISRSVHIFRPDGTGGHRQVGEIIEGEPILPGFACPVAALFEGL